MAQRSNLFLPLSLLLAWLFDFLFWHKAVGISFPIFVALALTAGFYLANRKGVQVASSSLWLLAPTLFFAAMSALRLEPFTLLLSRAFTLLGMALLATSFVGGRWLHYSLSDYVVKLVSFLPAGLLSYRQAGPDPERAEDKSGVRWRHVATVLRGLLLSLPILGVLGALLASADPIFGEWLEAALGFLNVDNLIEYLWRGTYIVVLAYLLVGVYFYALHNSRDEKLLGKNKPLMQSFLGFGEAATILSSVGLLFGAFVAVQFRYFFGGQANVNTAGFTYAQYARRGFMELVVVAVLSLLLFMLLSSISKRQGGLQQRAFSGLGIALMALVSVMLVSAYQRLLLYESAYGFTRVRTYAHTFMIWLGLLLLAIVILELLQRQRAFALAVLGAAVGFAASLGLLNVDGFIVNANLERARLGYVLDIQNLGWLSEDAVPALIEGFQQAEDDGAAGLGTKLAAALVCHAAQHEDYAGPANWQSLHFARQQAQQQWETFNAEPTFTILDASANGNLREGFRAEVRGQHFECGYSTGLD